jgi:hypothetical protein
MFDNPYLKVLHRSPTCGDCTCWYDLEVPKGWTLRDFIRYVCHEYAIERKEFGHIRKQPFDGYGDHIVTYNGRRSEVSLYNGEHYFTPEEKAKYLENSTALYNKYIDREIVSVRANGGWGAMDYYLDFGPEPISYANYEF